MHHVVHALYGSGAVRASMAWLCVTVRHNLEPGSNGAPVAADTTAASAEATESDDELEGGSSATWSPERRTAEELVGTFAAAPPLYFRCMRQPRQPRQLQCALQVAAFASCRKGAGG